MNYVDPIIKYLSGELRPEEEKSFRDDFSSREGFQEELDELSLAYELIGKQLRERDELAFKQKVMEAMDREQNRLGESPRRNRRWWLGLASIAATLSLVLVFSLYPAGKERILSRYYAPEQDQVVQTLLQDTRGKQERGISHYRNQEYSESMRILAPLLGDSSEASQFLLIYLLSAMELDRESEALEKLLPLEPEHARLPDQSLSWYASLALIKAERHGEARSLLEPLTRVSGPYQKDAENLLKHLLK